MTGAYISRLISPFARKNKLTYDDFDKIFGFLPRKEQYPIADTIQDVLHIELVDELDELPEESPKKVDPAREIKMPNKVLIRMIQDGDEQAKNDFCIKNSAFVEKCAVECRQKYKITASLRDLMRAGNIGLIEAAEEFTFDGEIDFESYAAQIIELAIRECVD